MYINEKEKFNKWVKINFKGLSAHTLKQVAVMMSGELFPRLESYVENKIDTYVYVHLFRYFQGYRDEKAVDAFDYFCEAVELCDWL